MRRRPVGARCQTVRMTDQDAAYSHTTPDGSAVPQPNTRPGPTDQGGHGGMATREQEARLRRKQQAGEGDDHDKESNKGEGDDH
jgi:hypothetical protein